MGKGAHYVNKKKKPYLKKSEWIALIAVLSLVALGAAGYFIAQAVLDKSLPVKDGAVVTGGENWIVVNEGSSSAPKYYKYGSYDFSPLAATVDVGGVAEDENATGLYLFPDDGAYDYAYLHGIGQDYAELSANVHEKMPSIVPNGEVRDMEPFPHGRRTGNIYWYTNRVVKTDADGIPLQDESGKEISEYTQVFSCYMPTSRGTIILRVSYKGDSEAAYVDPAVGYEQVGAILDCVTVE